MGEKKTEVDFHNSHHILEELKKDGKLKIEFARAMEIKVDVVRGDHKNDPLGLHFRDPVGFPNRHKGGFRQPGGSMEQRQRRRRKKGQKKIQSGSCNAGGQRFAANHIKKKYDLTRPLLASFGPQTSKE